MNSFHLYGTDRYGGFDVIGYVQFINILIVQILTIYT